MCRDLGRALLNIESPPMTGVTFTFADFTALCCSPIDRHVYLYATLR